MRQDVIAQTESSPVLGHDATAQRWQALWEHRPALLRVAERRCPSPVDAPDVVQEAVMRAAAKPDLRLDQAGAWMTRVVVNLCADLHRQPRHADLATTVELPSQRPECCSPEQLLDARGDVAVVLRRFPSLPPRQQEAVRLRASDLTVGEVADVMGLPYKTVESLLSRARRHLRVGLVLVAGTALARRALQLGGSHSTVSATATVVVSVGAGLAISAAGAGPVAPPADLTRLRAAPVGAETGVGQVLAGPVRQGVSVVGLEPDRSLTEDRAIVAASEDRDRDRPRARGVDVVAARPPVVAVPARMPRTTPGGVVLPAGSQRSAGPVLTA